MSASSRGVFPSIALLVFFWGCNLTVGIFPSEQCPARPVPVELTMDPPDLSLDPEVFHSTAGCTIQFDVREYHVYISSPYDPRWTPISGLRYEVRVEPEGTLGRFESGVLGDDGRVSVSTVEGNTAVMLTVFVPDPTGNQESSRSTLVYLDPPV